MVINQLVCDIEVIVRPSISQFEYVPDPDPLAGLRKLIGDAASSTSNPPSDTNAPNV